MRQPTYGLVKPILSAFSWRSREAQVRELFSFLFLLTALLSELSSVVLFPCMFYRKGSFNPGEHTTSFAGSREIALKDSVLEDATGTVFSLYAGNVADVIY